MVVLIFSLALQLSAQSHASVLRMQNATPIHLYDPDEDRVMKQAVPKFACMKDFIVTRHAGKLEITITMLAQRPLGIKDSEVVDLGWTSNPGSKENAMLFLLILEGGPIPHPKLVGRISRERAVLIKDSDKTKLVGTYAVLRRGPRLVVSLPAKLVSGYALTEVTSRWLPANAAGPFKRNGVLEYSVNNVKLNQEEIQSSIGSLTATIDDLQSGP